MRTLIDLPQADLDRLTAMSKAQKVSRAELVRRAVAGFLAEDQAKKPGFDASFGVWKDRAVDGVRYQQQLRDEWPE